MSDQNPMNRDGGRRDNGEQPYSDARESYAENEARVERNAPLPGTDSGLTEEEREKLEEKAAADRLDKAGQEVNAQREERRGDDHGN